jgi:hypothetical protein
MARGGKLEKIMNEYDFLNFFPWLVPVGLLVIVLAVKFLLDFFLD